MLTAISGPKRALGRVTTAKGVRELLVATEYQEREKM
jgi:hypothetical protein